MRRERLRQIDPHHRVVDLGRDRRAVHRHVAQLVAALEVAHAPARVRGEERRAFAAVPEEILVELQPDEPQRVGRVVRVADGHRAVDRPRRRVERRRDRVVGALLPVRRPRRPGRVPELVRTRPVHAVGRVERIVALLGIHGRLCAPSAGLLGHRRPAGRPHNGENEPLHHQSVPEPQTSPFIWPSPQSPIPNPQSPIPNPQSHPNPNPQSPIPNPQSPIPNPQSPIPNPQSPVPTPITPPALQQSRGPTRRRSARPPRRSGARSCRPRTAAPGPRDTRARPAREIPG